MINFSKFLSRALIKLLSDVEALLNSKPKSQCHTYTVTKGKGTGCTNNSRQQHVSEENHCRVIDVRRSDRCRPRYGEYRDCEWQASCTAACANKWLGLSRRAGAAIAENRHDTIGTNRFCETDARHYTSATANHSYIAAIAEFCFILPQHFRNWQHSLYWAVY